MVTQNTLKNISIVLLRALAGALLGLLTTSYLARLLEPANNGIYALVLLIPAMAVTFGGFGVSTATVFIVGQEKHHLPEVIAKLTFLSVVTGLAMGGVLLTLPNQLWNIFLPGVSMYLVYIGIGAIPILMLYNNLIAIYHGQQNFRNHGLLTLLPAGISLILITMTNHYFDDLLMFVTFAWLIGYAFTLILVLYQLRYAIKNFFHHLRRKNDLIRKTLNFGLKAYAGNIITFLNYRVNFFLIGALVNVEAVGIYAVTIPIVEAIWLLATAVASVIFPLIAKTADINNHKLSLTPIVSRWVLVVSILFGLFIAMSSNYIIIILFGEKYLRAVELIYWLLPGIVIFSVTKIVSSDIAGRGKPEINLYLTLFSLVANICFGYIFVPMFGLNGAAMALSATYFFYTLIASIVYSKIMGVNIIDLFIPKKEDIFIFRSALN